MGSRHDAQHLDHTPGPGAGRFLRTWSWLGLGLILLAAIRSDGFHQADEHFQTLEFAGLKLGRTPASDLPWEFAARMRSWLQPALYVLLVRAAEAAHIRDPFHQAFILRLFSGLVTWMALVVTTRAAWRWVPGDGARRWSVRLTWLAFFMPYLAVRTSSECLATSCFLLGLAALGRLTEGGVKAPRYALAAGLLFGFAFQLRFAVGVMCMAVVLWALLERHLRPRELGLLALASLPALLLGAALDRWGYGEWAVPAYEYVHNNFGLGIAAGRFGARPWYGYLVLGGQSALAPLVLLLQLGAVVAWLRWPRHVLTAATLPFVLVHCLIAHKELRFLFPIAPLLPTLLVLAVVGAGGAWWRPLTRPAARPVLLLLLCLDLVALAALLAFSTRPMIGIQRFVFRLAPERFEAVVLSPYTPWHLGRQPMHFYRPGSLELRLGLPLDEAAAPRRPFFVVTEAFDDPRRPGLACETLYRPFPSWLAPLTQRHPALGLRGWSLHRCRKGMPEAASPPVAIQRLDGTRIDGDALTARIEELARKASVHGLAVSVFNAGAPVYSRVFGVKRADTGEPLANDTVFYGASLSKAVFAVLVMRLVEDGRIDLDTPLVTYLDRPIDALEPRSSKAWHENLKDLAADPRQARITARMCLAHTAGMPNWRWFEPDQKLRIKTEPGARYSYSSEGLTVLQVVLERLTSKRLEELATEEIFVPFGMTTSSYTWQPRFESNYCHGHDEAGKVLEKDKDNAARSASTLETTLDDYTRFLGAVLGGKALKPSSRDEMFRTQVRIRSKRQFGPLASEDVADNDRLELGYGLGWGVLKTPDGTGAFKEGHGDGFEHYSIVFPASGTGVLILSNSANGESVFKELLELTIADTYTPWEWQDYVPYSR